MKQKLLIMMAAMLLVPMGIFSQTYQELWKQVEQAQRKDLPKTAMEHLQQIETKAQKAGDYGQLLKATLLTSKLQAEVAPDSLQPAVKRLEREAESTKDLALKAVYCTVLSKVYEHNSYHLGEDAETVSQRWRQQALEHPEALAQVKGDTYHPFVIDGKDSKAYYDDDLLNIVGRELSAWQWLHEYYSKAGNRRAACLTGVQAFDDIASIDSLIAVYGDLPEACELAIKRFNLMDGEHYSVAQRIGYLRESLTKWGDWKRANWFRNMEHDMTRPTFTAQIPEHIAMPQQPQTVKLESVRNIQSLTMNVYETTLKGDTELNPDLEKDYKKIKSHLKLRMDLTKTVQFTGHADYESFEDSLLLAGLEPGVYLIEFTSPQTETARRLYFVSGVRVMAQAMPKDRMRYVVVDARTGQPIPQATLRVKYRAGWKMPEKTDDLTCDRQGEVMLDNSARSPWRVYGYTKNDVYNPPMSSYGRYTYYGREYHSEHINVFTDRSIYRPGQTVHVTAIVWKEQSALDNVAVAGKGVRLELRDANYKTVGETQVTTDRYGKCSTTFTLPKGLLNGRFTVRANNSSINISVEEYKRPTFQVEFDEYKEAYQAGDTIRTQGKAMTYAGVPVQDAKVKYTVKRRVAYWWMSYSWYWQSGYFGRGLQEEVVNEGEATTDDEGKFLASVPLTLPDEVKNARMYYHFVVEVNVTDVGGETHYGTQTLPLGTKPTALTCDLPQQVRSDQLPEVTFSRYNAAGKTIEGTVKYRLDGGKWKQCAANCQLSIVNSQLKSGEHRLEAVCENDSIDMTFVVFGLDDTKPAAKTNDWFYASASQFPRDGKPVTIQVGSSDPDVHMVYGIYAGDSVIEQGVVKKNGELLNRKFTYKEAYGNGLLVSYAWVKDGQFHQHQHTIGRPMPDKRLRLTWETFRDRLTPGQQEEWRLRIVNPDGTPADASLMAVLYDKSLDQIKPHQWSFSPTNYLPKPSTNWNFRNSYQLQWYATQPYQSPLKVTGLVFSRFDDSVYPDYLRGMIGRGAGRMLMKANAAAPMEDGVLYETAAPMEESKVFDVVGNDEAALEEVVVKGVSEEPQQEDNVQMRENLNETAFCYPQLTTDEQGRVVMKFTLPESLTTWRFMGIANTQQMLYGRIEGEAVAQKDVMVQPNVPRFVRMGDEAQLTARIFNTGEKAVSGKAKLLLLDAETEKVVFTQEQSFSVEAGKTGAVTFKVESLQLRVESSALLICKVMVIGDGFSDGEQHYLPVLPNREYVTKTVPYTQHEPGVKTIDLTKLFPQGTTLQKLTIEYTNNPAWLMVQSLPVLGQPWEHSAIDQAASYYSNLLAKSLLDESPQVKKTFELWKQESLTSDLSSLTSQLEKDQELKDLILAETPWVRDADRESEQKQRLADFFDENGIANRLETAVAKLKKLQNPDGSFSWYPGMQGSTYITVAIEEMLIRLNRMVGKQDDTKQMQDKAFKYIGKEMVDLVKELKKQEKKGYKPSFPTFTALRWLYLCALDGRQLENDVKTANDYLIALLKKDIKRQTIYEKALTAIVLSQHGEAKRAAEYVQSLKEYTVYTEEMGRYYDTPRAGYSWYDYKIPTEVAAIEAIQMVAPNDQQTVDEMRRWLLQEKRTQMWDTPISSVNAIYAFLNNQNSLNTQGAPSVLAIDGTPVELPKATAGLGYVKTAIQEPKGQTFTATKTSEGTSWGAVYAQFFQKTSDIEQSQSGISVKREVLLAGKPLTTGALTIGDRIKVRLTIECTRDLDFVQVVDRRAACMEPVKQLSGYQNGAYVSPKDYATNYYFYGLSKGKHVIETEYYIDRAGTYESGSCTVQCAYAPEYRATAPSVTFNVK